MHLSKIASLTDKKASSAFPQLATSLAIAQHSIHLIPTSDFLLLQLIGISPTDNKKWSNGETTFSLVERAENSH